MTNEEKMMLEWLARQLVNHGLCPPDTTCSDEQISKCKPNMALKCWIRMARKAVENK